MLRLYKNRNPARARMRSWSDTLRSSLYFIGVDVPYNSSACGILRGIDKPDVARDSYGFPDFCAIGGLDAKIQESISKQINEGQR